MYRLLIVDDEVAIVLGLEKILAENGRYELDIYKAFGTTEALEIARGKGVDILLADICMPGMDGLELGREVVKYNKNCKIIYLTGFGNFEYIYEAMERMGSQYLLKSESDEKIGEAVGRAVEMLEAELRRTVGRVRLRLEQKKSESLIKKDVLARLLYGEYSRKQFAGQIQKYQLSLEPEKEGYLFVAIPRTVQEGHIEKLDGLYQAKVVLDERFEEDFLVESMVWEEELLVWILQLPEKGRVLNVRRQLQRTAEEFQEITNRLNGWLFHAGYMAKGQPVDMLFGDFHKLVLYMKISVQSGVPMIYDWESCRGEQGSQEQEMSLKKLETYVEEHVGEDISLDHLAELIHFNPSYLSRFYKKNRGMTLSEYIAGVRVRKAERMLRDTGKRIADIASDLGFETPSAFCAFFRRKTGQTPMQYRKIV